jgi:hypothetical protein
MPTILYTQNANIMFYAMFYSKRVPLTQILRQDVGNESATSLDYASRPDARRYFSSMAGVR